MSRNIQEIVAFESCIQRQLFPQMEKETGPLGDKARRLIKVLELSGFERFVDHLAWTGVGRKPNSRAKLFAAFLAKSVYGIGTTTGLIEYLKLSPQLRQLCSYQDYSEVPSESTFSRAFESFAECGVASAAHEALISGAFTDKIVGHIARDSVAIRAREKAKALKHREDPAIVAFHAEAERARKAAGRKKRGRKPLGDKCKRKPAPTVPRIEVQCGRTLEANIADLGLDNFCQKGVKNRNAQGYRKAWNGYKLHLDVADCGVPISALVTGAAVNDSQAAVPLTQMSTSRVTYLYELSDSAYDAKAIDGFSRLNGHVPITEPHCGPGRDRELAPARRARYAERTVVERINSEVIDTYGGRNVRVRGGKKVMAHLMIGVLSLTVVALCRLAAG